MVFDAFVGPSYTAQSLNVDCERAVNLYVEGTDQGAQKAQKVLYGSPGIHLFCTLPEQPVRGIWIGSNRMFCIAGSGFY